MVLLAIPPSSQPCPLREGCPDKWGWSRTNRSPEVRLVGVGGHRAHFHPNWSNGSAAVRGSKVLNYGRYYWEVKLSERVFGTSMMFGVCTSKARLHADSFVNLIGEDKKSWGLSHKGMLWHNGQCRPYTKAFKENQPCTVGMLFDWYAGTLTYYKDGVSLGVAFTGLSITHDRLYPVISSTAAKTEMSLGVTFRGMESLQDRCRAIIAKAVAKKTQVDDLPLPNRIKGYVKEIVT